MTNIDPVPLSTQIVNVIASLQAKVAALTAQRDRLLAASHTLVGATSEHICELRKVVREIEEAK